MTTPVKSTFITPFLRISTALEVIVLIGAGGVLFFSPQWAHDQWAWELTPFNTRFLGAFYLAAALSIAVFVWVRQARYAPPILQTIFVFTTIILVCSLLYLDQFDFDQSATWLWFALYIFLPINSGYHLWLYRSVSAQGAPPPTTPRTWRTILIVATVLLIGYGVGLLILPKIFSDLFPWALDEFHSRVYSATFIAGGIGLMNLIRVEDPLSFIAAGLSQAVFGLFAILGLLIVDADVNRIDWSALNTWLWLASFAALLVLGAAMIITGIRSQASE